MALTSILAAIVSGDESEAGMATKGGRIALDTNALIAAIEEPTSAAGKAVLEKIAGKQVALSRTAIKEFLAKGSAAELREFMAKHNGRIAQAAPAITIRILKGLGLRDHGCGCVQIIGSAETKSLAKVDCRPTIESRMHWDGS
jgi:hypothetical protein